MKKRKPLPKGLVTSLKVCGSLAGILFLLHSIDIHKVEDSFSGMNIGLLLVGIAFTLLSIGGSIVEWGVFLRANNKEFRWLEISSIYIQSLFFGHLLPTGVGGDAMRTITLGKKVGHEKVLASVVASRLAGSLGMALWAFASTIILRQWFGWLGIIFMGIFLAFILGSWLITIKASIVLRVLRTDKTSGKRVWIRHKISDFLHVLQNYTSSPSLIAQGLTAGILGWFANLYAYVFFAYALHLNVGWEVFAIILPASLLATLTPFALNGIGLREGVFVGLIAKAGVNASSAIALALLIDIQILPFAIFGGLIWMQHRKHEPVSVAEDVITAKEIELISKIPT